MRLIDADALKKTLEKLWNIHDDQDFANKDVWREIENAPTIDPESSMSGDLIRRQDAIAKFKKTCTYESIDKNGIKRGEIHSAITYEKIIKIIESLPSAELERKKGRKFLGIVVRYPKICTYPEYEGKPYYSIKYEENGEMIVGYGTYKPEVLSQNLREDFISPAEPERKKGQWIEYPDCLRYEGAYNDDHIVCSECGHVFSICDNCTEEFDFYPHCGSYNGEQEK